MPTATRTFKSAPKSLRNARALGGQAAELARKAAAVDRLIASSDPRAHALAVELAEEVARRADAWRSAVGALLGE